MAAQRIEVAMANTTNATATFAALANHKYFSLETFRKSGQGVRTPIWFAPDPSVSLDSGAAKLYVYTIGNSGKVKRLRNTHRVRIAPCDMRGRLLGSWMDGQAEIVTGAEAERGQRLLKQKYFPWKQLLDFFASFSRREHVVIVISPA
jgi:uncharacterized protein